MAETVLAYIRDFPGEKQFVLPLTDEYTYELPTISVTLYLLMVFVGPRIMKHLPTLNFFSVILPYWNLFLSVGSLIMFIGIVPGCLSHILEHGFLDYLCLPNRELYHGVPFFWIYIFCMSKFIELLDTFFLVVRKRNIDFLHYYHHTTVLLYCWFAMVALPGGVGFTFGILNSAVHTIMYFYYYLSSFYRPSWGKYVTYLQLSQMVVGIVMASAWTYMYIFGGDYCTRCPYPLTFIFASLGMYTSYFMLFLSFYIKRYVKAQSKRE